MKQHGPKIKILRMVVEFSKATAMPITDKLQKKREKNFLIQHYISKCCKVDSFEV